MSTIVTTDQLIRIHASTQSHWMPTPAEVQFIAWMERVTGKPAFFYGGYGCYNWMVGRTLVTLWMERYIGQGRTYERVSGVILYHGADSVEWKLTGGELARKAVLRLLNGGAA